LKAALDPASKNARGEETETETEPTFGQLRSYVKGGGGFKGVELSLRPPPK